MMLTTEERITLERIRLAKLGEERTSAQRLGDVERVEEIDALIIATQERLDTLLES